MTDRWKVWPHLLACLLTLLISLPLLGAGYKDNTVLQSQYSSAVRDARSVSFSKIYRDLTPIVNENQRLVWENGVVGSRLLVVSWVGSGAKRFYDGTMDPACAVGSKTCPITVDLWVTVVPDLKSFFLGRSPDPLRIAQLLGLPPDYADDERSFVEMWVSPHDLFRPCPDPEISDAECELHFPADGFRSFISPELLQLDSGPPPRHFTSYKAWFNNRKNLVYSDPDQPHYPWTRLGYTYDWGSVSHIGMSEFVLHGNRAGGTGVSVGIRSVLSTADYFSP